MTNGLLFPTRGQVLVEGKSTRDWDPIRLKRHIGYVIQEVGLFPHFTIGRNVGLVPTLEKQQGIDARVDTLLNLVGLPAAEYRNRYPRQLSGGQRQRAGSCAGRLPPSLHCFYSTSHLERSILSRGSTCRTSF